MTNFPIENKSFKASEFGVDQWIDAGGNKMSPLRLSDLKGTFKVVYCFQSWCQGCHSRGFPSLQKMANQLKDNPNVSLLAIQTVFEGHQENTFDKIISIQKQYDLKIPFGHDAGNDGKSTSNMMINYRTGGTPWFIFIDKNEQVVFADFHLNTDAAIDFLKTI